MSHCSAMRVVVGLALVAAAWAAAGETALPDVPGEPMMIDKPLVAYWSFDEEQGGDCLDVTGNGNNAAPEGTAPEALLRTEGLFDGGIALSGTHLLRVPERPDFAGRSKLSLSAWLLPTSFGGYSEIFRKEDGENRVLFSFQLGGTILSLGLNVNGYVECDAHLDPAQVLDGRWHHCAATFDGAVMRVYLDGREIGALDRPGTISAGGKAPSCIGSANGGECFQGAMDELRIYDDALTPEEIAALYHNGANELARFAKEMEASVDAVCAIEDSFSKSLAATRNNLMRQEPRPKTGVAAAALARLQSAFPKEYAAFSAGLGVRPNEYLSTEDDGFLVQRAGLLMDLMLEYKPLTDHQRQSQTAADLEQWAQADALRQRFDALMAQGDAARFSPEWIDLIVEATPRIQFRPSVSEPVAPYLTPETPATRDLAPEEARAALERDWLYQADQNPSKERIQSEIQWTLQLIARITGQSPDRVDFSAELEALDRLDKRAAALDAPDAGLYFEVRSVKRGVMLKNPAVDFTKVLLVDMPFPQGSEWPHETRHRLGYMAVPGGRLLILDGLGPDGHLTQLMPQAPLHGSFWRPDLSYDAQKVLFCFKPHNEKAFHLYEINVDGSGLTQLTDGIYDDFDPIYLPDDQHLMFSTTRGHTYVRCMPPTNAFPLARADRDGKNIYIISTNNEPDYLPSVMDDGRIVYTRWEYTDKPLWRAEKLWTINPDGTTVTMLWGNQSVWPDLLKDARNIPGSRRIMFTGSAHHNWFNGSVGIIDPEKGLNFPNGLTKVTADTEWPECGNGPVDPVESPRYHASGTYRGYYSPYPLSETDFLVSANRDGKFVLYLMDVDGNRELVYEGVNQIFHAMPLKPRVKPPVLADRVAWPSREDRLHPKPGLLYTSNVYDGAPEELRGHAKSLRILSIDAKTYSYWYKRPYLSTGPVVSAVQSEGVKRLLGTVPIEPDGSVYFEAPSGISLHFQLLDENGRALQTMRSFASLMPGERRGCLGCHEAHSRTTQPGTQAIALGRSPSPITPPPWSDLTVSYPRYVQPVLNQYCGKCHQGEGKARKTLDLTERPSEPIFTEPYLTLIGRPTWGAPYKRPEKTPPGFGIANMLMVEAYSTVDPAAYVTPKPMTQLSYNSRLIDIASSGKHHDVKVDPVSLARLIVWVDAMCPYRGDEEVRDLPDPEFQGVDWLAIRPLIKNAPVIVRPGPMD